MFAPDSLPLKLGKYIILHASDEPEWYSAKIEGDESGKSFICKIINTTKPTAFNIINCHERMRNNRLINPIVDCLNATVPEDMLRESRSLCASRLHKSSQTAAAAAAAASGGVREKGGRFKKSLSLSSNSNGGGSSQSRTNSSSSVASSNDAASVEEKIEDSQLPEPQNNNAPDSPPGPMRRRSSTNSSTDSNGSGASFSDCTSSHPPTYAGELCLDNEGKRFRKLNIVFLESHGTSLHSFVREKRKLSEETARRIFYEIVDIIEECHKLNVCLRDLKMRKLVWKKFDDGTNRLILENLDNSVLLPSKEVDKLYDRQGTPAYCCPEMLRTPPGRSYSGLKADVWCLGVILYSMTAGRYPYHDVDPMRMISKIRRGYRLQFPGWLSSRARSLMANLLHQDADKRLSIEEIRAHAWINRSYNLAVPSPRRLLDTWGAKHGAHQRCETENDDDGCVPVESVV